MGVGHGQNDTRGPGRGGGLPGPAGTEAERVVQTGWTSGGNGVIDIFA
mgnify:CR=1 FL=1